MSTTEPSGFQRIIQTLPKTLKVLDVGSGGLEGENTTQYLAEHFESKNILGICKSAKQVEIYQAQRAERKEPALEIVVDDFYAHEHSGLFDLVVLDLNIENNVQQDWTPEGLQRVSKLLNPGGYLINYVMLTDQYGDPETPQIIRSAWQKFYGTNEMICEVVEKRLNKIDGFELFSCEQESRRPYIYWVCLKKV